MHQRFETFTVLIANISRSIRKIKTQEMESLNLKGTHVSCLYYLYREGEMTAARLCELCEEDKANISRAIDHLETEGYIVSRSAAQKRYRAPLELTEKGRDAGEAVAQKVDRILVEASDGLDETERAIMYKSLSRVCDNLHRICGDYDTNTKKCCLSSKSKDTREE